LTCAVDAIALPEIPTGALDPTPLANHRVPAEYPQRSARRSSLCSAPVVAPSLRRSSRQPPGRVAWALRATGSRSSSSSPLSSPPPSTAGPRRAQRHPLRSRWSALPSLSNWRYTRCSSAFRIVSACCIPEHPVTLTIDQLSAPGTTVVPIAVAAAAASTRRHGRRDIHANLFRLTSKNGVDHWIGLGVAVVAFVLSVHLQGVPGSFTDVLAVARSKLDIEATTLLARSSPASRPLTSGCRHSLSAGSLPVAARASTTFGRAWRRRGRDATCLGVANMPRAWQRLSCPRSPPPTVPRHPDQPRGATKPLPRSLAAIANMLTGSLRANPPLRQRGG